jgi:hypothetical protein
MMVSFVTSHHDDERAFGETLYVAAKTAQLRSGKTSLDPVVASLKLGESLDSCDAGGPLLQVQPPRVSRDGSYYKNVSR